MEHHRSLEDMGQIDKRAAKNEESKGSMHHKLNTNSMSKQNLRKQLEDSKKLISL